MGLDGVGGDCFGFTVDVLGGDGERIGLAVLEACDAGWARGEGLLCARLWGQPYLDDSCILFPFLHQGDHLLLPGLASWTDSHPMTFQQLLGMD